MLPVLLMVVSHPGIRMLQLLPVTTPTTALHPTLPSSLRPSITHLLATPSLLKVDTLPMHPLLARPPTRQTRTLPQHLATLASQRAPRPASLPALTPMAVLVLLASCPWLALPAHGPACFRAKALSSP